VKLRSEVTKGETLMRLDRTCCYLAALFMLCSGICQSDRSYAVQINTVFNSIGDAPNFRAFGLSPNGQYVVGWRDLNDTRVAFRWDEITGITLLGDLSGGRVWSEAQAVSNTGLVVGDAEVNDIGGTNPFRWDAVSGMVSLGTLGGSETQGFAHDVSADGTVVVGMSKDPQNRQIAFRWTQSGGMVPLGIFGSSQSSEADGISGDGNVIVGSGSSATEGWYWTAANGFKGVGLFSPGTASIPRAASTNGNVIVGEASTPGVSNRLAFVSDGAGTFTSLGDIPNATTASVAYDVSGDGGLIVGRSDTDIAVIWERVNGSYHIYDLKQFLQDRYGLVLDGWELQQASSISADGRTIAGYGVSPNGGGIRAWRVSLGTPVPEPEYLAMIGFVSMISIVNLHRRARRPL